MDAVFVAEQMRGGLRALKAIGAGAICLVVSGACCCGGGGGIGQLDSAPPTNLLTRFQNFPADQVPRLIVRLNNRSAADREAFFPNQQENYAFDCNRFELATTLPSDGPSVATANWSDGTSATYPAVSAQDTFNLMLNQARPGLEGCGNPAPLPVTHMRPGTALFITDRGTARLSVWLVTIPGNVHGEIAYPAIPPSAFWRDYYVTGADFTATVSPDGLSITLHFIGTQADGRYGNSYKGLVAESSSAVALAIQRIPNPTSLTDTGLRADQQRSVSVVLQAPLDGRVVVGPGGYVIPICPEAMSAGC
jgi:hypothetical protein